MNVLVTGGAGYIGSHTCVELLESGYGVVVIDNLCNSNPESLRRVQELTGKSLKFYEGDVRDEALLEKIFAENEIGCVIHFAGLKAVGESVEKPWEYYDNNLNSTLILTKVMKKVGMKNIIFSSSATVYSGDNAMPLQESSRTGNCTNPYGWTKYMTEQILSGMAHADKEWGVVLLRAREKRGCNFNHKILFSAVKSNGIFSATKLPRLHILKRVTDKADRYRSTEASQGAVVRRRVKKRRVRCSGDVLAWGCISIPFVF